MDEEIMDEEIKRPEGAPPPEVIKAMKSAGRRISLCMGVTLSFCLSLIGTLMGGHFSPAGWLISFLVSLVISIIIGFTVPMGKISQSVRAKHGDTIKARLIDSLYSDLIFTPIITILMNIGAYVMAMKMSGGQAEMNLPMMIITSLIVCMVVGYIIIFIVQPIFMKIFIKNKNPNN